MASTAPQRFTLPPAARAGLRPHGSDAVSQQPRVSVQAAVRKWHGLGGSVAHTPRRRTFFPTLLQAGRLRSGRVGQASSPSTDGVCVRCPHSEARAEGSRVPRIRALVPFIQLDPGP